MKIRDCLCGGPTHSHVCASNQIKEKGKQTTSSGAIILESLASSEVCVVVFVVVCVVVCVVVSVDVCVEVRPEGVEDDKGGEVRVVEVSLVSVTYEVTKFEDKLPRVNDKKNS